MKFVELLPYIFSAVVVNAGTLQYGLAFQPQISIGIVKIALWSSIQYAVKSTTTLTSANTKTTTYYSKSKTTIDTATFTVSESTTKIISKESTTFIFSTSFSYPTTIVSESTVIIESIFTEDPTSTSSPGGKPWATKTPTRTANPSDAGLNSNRWSSSNLALVSVLGSLAVISFIGAIIISRRRSKEARNDFALRRFSNYRQTFMPSNRRSASPTNSMNSNHYSSNRNSQATTVPSKSMAVDSIVSIERG
jgi:hypothetical protein